MKTGGKPDPTIQLFLNISGIATVLSLSGSVLIYTASSFDRYLAVKNPLRSKNQRLLLAKISLGVIWFIAGITAVCPLFLDQLSSEPTTYQFVAGLIVTGRGMVVGIVYLIIIEGIIIYGVFRKKKYSQIRI